MENFVDPAETSDEHSLLSFSEISARHYDRLAGDILDALVKRGSTLNLVECKGAFNIVQEIMHKTSGTDLADKHYVNSLIHFLEADKKGGAGFSYRAFVSRFGSETAQVEFDELKPETREEYRRRCDAEKAPEEDLFKIALDSGRALIKRLLAKVTSQ